MTKLSRDFRSVAPAGIALAVCFGLAACKKSEDAKDSPAADASISVKKSQIPALENPHCLYGCPVGAAEDNRVIQRSIYALSNNKTTKFADWVAYTVKQENIGMLETRNFTADPALPAGETLKLTDYINARDVGIDYDRGHQAPLKTLSNHPDWAESNYLSNITPQKMELNEGPWLQLENRERSIATCTSKVKKQNRNLVACETQGSTEPHVLTGPLYEAEMPKLPRAKQSHTVPSAYWKIVAVEENGQLRVGAFIMEQSMRRSDRYCGKAVTVEEVEKRTKYTFFPLYTKGNNFKEKPGVLMFNLGC